MTVEKIIHLTDICNDQTEIYIRNDDFHVVAHGNWFQDNILDHMQDIVDCFTWQDDNKLYIDVKEGEQ